MSSGENFESFTGRWRKSSKRSMRVSTLVTSVVVALFLICGALLVAFIAWQNSRSRIEEAELRARGTAAILAQLYADAAQSHGYGHGSMGGIRLLLENWFAKGSADKDLAWAYVRDADKHIVAGQLRAHLLPNLPPGLDDQAARSWFFAQQDNPGKGFIRHGVKLERGDEGQRERYGEVKIGYSLARIERDFRRQLWISALIGILGVALLSVFMLTFLRRLVLTPLKGIAMAMEQVREGRLETRAPVVRGDEIGALAETFNYMVTGLAERDRLEDAFQRYVSRQVLEKIRSSGEDLQLLGESRRATVLFSDIRGFTSMNERLTPEQVVSGLNEYFTEMVDVIFRYDGFINKFVGDAIMAVWGAPFDQSQAELHAVQAALDMFAALQALNQRRQNRGEAILQIGIGINTGTVVSGNIGHVERMEYTVIGDAVNVAQRIESQTKVLGKQLLVSDETWQAIKDLVVSEEMPKVVVKGRQQAILLHAVHAMSPSAQAHNQAIAPKTDTAFAIPPSPAPALAEQTDISQPFADPPGDEASLPYQDPDLNVGIDSPLQSSEMTVPQIGAMPPQAFPEVTIPGVDANLVRATQNPNAQIQSQPAPTASVMPQHPVEQAMPVGEFSDPVTSKVYEAKFFNSPPGTPLDDDDGPTKSS